MKDGFKKVGVTSYEKNINNNFYNTFFFVGISTSRAYNEEVSPMLDLTNIAEFEFEQKWTDEQYQMALDWKNNYCQGYDHYIFTSTNGWIGSGNSSDNYLNMYCFNGNYNDIFLKYQNIVPLQIIILFNF